jgi:DNA polymerase III delta prime subunit
MKTKIGLQTFKSLLVAGDMQAAINVLEESDRLCSSRYSNRDCLQIVSSYGLILLLNLIVRIATEQASCAGEVNLRIATLAIQRKMVEAELLDREKLKQALTSVYREAVLLAKRDLAQDGYDPEQLLGDLDHEDVLLQAIALILA